LTALSARAGYIVPRKRCCRWKTENARKLKMLNAMEYAKWNRTPKRNHYKKWLFQSAVF